MIRYLIISILFIFPLDIFAKGGLVLTSPFFITDPSQKSVVKTPQKKGSKITQRNKYETLSSTGGVTLKRNLYGDIYLVEFDLSRGIRAISLGQPERWDEISGEPLYPKKTIEELRNESHILPLVAVNGQFFDPKRNPTPLSFGLKESGEVRTAGSDNRDEEKKIFNFGSGYAEILPYSWQNLRDANGDIAIVGLSLDNPHYRHASIGRTLFCLKNPDKDSRSVEVILLLAENTSAHAAEHILTRLGCQRDTMIILDSSGSSQLLFGDISIRGNAHKGVPDYRKIPHAIGFHQFGIGTRGL